MELRFEKLSLASMDALRVEALALGVFDDERPLTGAGGLCDWRLCGDLSRWVEKGWLSGRTGECALAPTRGRFGFEKLVVLGLGPTRDFAPGPFSVAMGTLVRTLRHLRLRVASVALPGRANHAISVGDAVRLLLGTPGIDDHVDELILLDEPDARRIAQPIIDSERRRLRAARDLGIE